MIIQGQNVPSSELQKNLSELIADPRAVMIAENISNIRDESIINCPELLLSHQDWAKLPVPDLLIYSGGQVVSKKLKLWLRSLSLPSVWRVGEDLFEMDTFRQQNKFLHLPQAEAYRELTHHLQKGRGGQYKADWMKAISTVRQLRNDLLAVLPFSDLTVTDELLGSLPEGSIIELGNSSSVRLSQLSRDLNSMIFYSNRGVSGIDGSLSTAVGTAVSSGKMTFALLGDLGFVYDSNALWNRELPANLRIVVLNNKGGQIFSLIPGPGKKEAYEDFFIAYHPVKLQKLAEAFNLNYFCVSSERELADTLPVLLAASERAVLAEIRTDPEINQDVFNRILGK
jgi:2-succinyl-5-enolpyruvyl-6-hydroxy-3-cyclohexene-1-carboxylate synthase